MFGLIDLEGNSMAGAAGAMAPQILLGADQIVMSNLNAQKAQQDMLRQSREDQINELLLPIRVGTESLANLQKLNVIPEEPNEDDISRAFEEIKATPNFDQLSPEQAQAMIYDRAQALAKSRRPDMNPYAPREFLDHAARVGVSDLEAQIMKNEAAAQGRIAVENIRQEGQSNRTLQQISGMLNATGIKTSTQMDIATQNRLAKEAEERRKRAEKQRREREVRGQQLLDNGLRRFSAIGGRPASRVTRHQRDALVAYHDSMAEFPEFQAQLREALPLLQELLSQGSGTPMTQVNQQITESMPFGRRPRNLSQMQRQQGPQPSQRDIQAMEWLQKNPDHPSAEGVRSNLQRKGLL